MMNPHIYFMISLWLYGYIYASLTMIKHFKTIDTILVDSLYQMIWTKADKYMY